MTSIATTTPTETISGVDYIRKAKGELVPISAVKPQHLMEDELVRRLIARAAELNAELAAFRALITDEVTTYRTLLSEKYGVKRGGRRGGVVLRTLDGTMSLTIQTSDTLTFGPELDDAKTIIDGCIRRWSAGANDNIRALVDQAFQVDKAGRVSVERILGLRQLQMTDDTGEWARAMDIISDAVRTQSSKEYARFHVGNALLPLDLANA